MDWIKALIVTSLLLFLILLLWVVNTKKENRYKQILNLPVFIIITGISIYFYKYLYDTFFKDIVSYINWKELEGMHIGILLAIIFSTLVFSIVKPVLHWLRKYFSYLFVYEKISNAYFFRNDFTFTKKVIKVSIIILSVLSLLFFYYFSFHKNVIFYLMYLLLLFTFELFWYINGKIKVQKIQETETEELINKIIVKNDTNFEKVLTFFRNHKEILKDEKLIKITKIRRSNKNNLIENTTLNQKKGDLILHSGNYSLLKDELKNKITEIVLNGGNVLIVAPFWNIIFKNNDEELENPYYKDLNSYFEELLKSSFKLSDSFDIQVYSSAHGNEKLKKNIVMTSAFDILYFNRFIQDNINWFSKLDLVIFENVLEKIVFSRSAQSSLSIILKAINKKVAFWFLGYTSLGFESAIRSQFLRQGDIEEVPFTANPEQLSYILSLKNENRALQNSLHNLSDKDYMGNESLVIYEANKLGQKNNQWIYSYEQPDADYVEEIKQTTVLDSVKNIDNANQALIQLIDNEDKPFFVVNDDKHNLSNLLFRLRLKNNEKAFYAISNYPYLFRDYMHDNLQYFFEHPLHHIAPQIDQNDYKNSLITLFESLKKYRLTEKEIAAIFNEQNIEDIVAYIDEKFRKAFDFKDFSKYIQVFTKKDIYNQWKPIKTYFIKSDSDITLNPLFTFFEIKDGNIANSNSFGRIQKGLAYQFFFRKPLHTYHNKSFRLKKIDIDNKIILLEHEQEKVKDKWFASKGINDVSILKIHSLPPVKHKRNLKIRLGLVEADYTIDRIGRYDFIGNTTYDYKKATKYGRDFFEQFFEKKSNVDEELLMKYEKRRTLYLSFDVKDLIKEKLKLDNETINLVIGKIAYSISFLVLEALQTFFSDTIEYIHVVPLNTLPAEYDEMRILPKVSLDDESFEDSDESIIKILILEDAPLDLGILEALNDRLYNVVLGYIDDYLRWHISKFETLETAKEQKRIFGQISVEEGHIVKGGVDRKSEYDNIHSFLKCVDNEYPNFFDFINTKILLTELFGINELTRSRINYSKTEDIEEIINGEDSDLPHYCDFCGSEYSLEEMDVIVEDGRERCPVCSENAIDAKEDILQLHKNEINSFFEYFKLEMPSFNEISINYKNAKEINAHYGKDFISTRFFDMRILGFATIKEDKYYIEAENMSPKKRTILTTIHEMVHIWQFLHLDFKKMEKDYDLYLIEGHTTWCEIYYAKQIANWTEDWESLIAPENRKDEYGDGYRLIKQLLKEFGKENPFELLLNMYGKE